VHCPAERDGYDPARMAYLLMEELYHWFGFNSQAMPYVDNSGPVPRLDGLSSLQKPLPTDPPETPGFM
jgi:hypothetical protein